MELIAVTLALGLIFYEIKVVSDYIELSCIYVANKFKIPASVAGATLLAVTSSAPEFFTSLSSAVFQGIFKIGLITIIWSAIFNILVIPGASGIMAKEDLIVTKKGTKRDMIFYIAIIFTLLLSISDSVLTREEGGTFVLIYLLYIYVLYRDSQHIATHDKLKKVKASQNQVIFSFTAGIILIGILCWSMIETGLYIANYYAIDIAVISAIIFAIGTSIPDLFLSLASVKRGSGSASISNAFGSNTFDIAIALGVPIILVGPIKIDNQEILISIVMLIISVIYIAAILINNWKLTRIKGVFSLLLFIFLMILLIMDYAQIKESGASILNMFL